MQPTSTMGCHPGRYRRALCFTAALTVAGCTRTPALSDAVVHDGLAQALQAKGPAFDADTSKRALRVWEETRRFYERNGLRLAWSDGRKPEPTVDGLLTALRSADREGLDPTAHDAAGLDAARQAFETSQAFNFDVRCTYAYLRYGWDLSHGSSEPETVAPQWHAPPRGADLPAALAQALERGAIEASFEALAPQAPPYQGLKHRLALARERQDTAEVDRIALNMDRWLPNDLGPRYLIVNIPAFRLEAIENGASVLSMRVVTGKENSPTPVLADEITSIVFSPYWNIPESIVEKEILPRLERDPDYLDRNNMEMDESGQRYRQRPGRGNSLGAVKFVFPNHFNVYLHGTPSTSLFKRVERDFSHGCVRLENPLELATYVLSDQPEWTEERITAAMNSGVELGVKLTTPLPIYLVYFTTWEEGGRAAHCAGCVRPRSAPRGWDRGCMTIRVLVSVAFAVWCVSHVANANGFDAKTTGFTISFYGEKSPYRDTSAFVLPGAATTLEVTAGPPGKYSLTAKDGMAVQQAARRWRFTAPKRPGLYTLKVDGPANKDSIDIHLFVMEPAARVKAGWLNGYRIGNYPAPSSRYVPPKGFVEVTKDNQDTSVSPHFKLKQFVCKQEPETSFPKYVVLEERLLLKLEAILEHVNRLGFSADTLHVMSAYRTPYYNHALGDVKYSMHQWGGAADIYIDPKDKDRMEDLNRDGRVDIDDARFLYDRIEELFAATPLQKFEGGLGFYPATSAHQPFVHVDVRGTRARWKG